MWPCSEQGDPGKVRTVKSMLRLGPGAGQMQTHSDSQNVILAYENEG